MKRRGYSPSVAWYDEWDSYRPSQLQYRAVRSICFPYSAPAKANKFTPREFSAVWNTLTRRERLEYLRQIIEIRYLDLIRK